MSGSRRTRGNRQRLRGIVVRDKAANTITVEVVHRFRHPRYGKMVRRHTRLAAHDAAGEAHLGDTVEIVSCRPLSKTKRFRLVRVLERSPGVGLVGQPPDQAEPQSDEPAEAAPAAPLPGETPEPADRSEAPAESEAAPDQVGEAETASPGRSMQARSGEPSPDDAAPTPDDQADADEPGET